jgi:methyl-accepting chemotaxis protein
MNEYIQHLELTSSQRIEDMTHLNSTIKLLYEPIEEIKRNIKRLNMLGFTTRIHSGVNDGSSLLADDIEKLSSEILVKKTYILENLQSLSTKVEETLENVYSINENHLKNSWIIVNNTMSSLTNLKEKRSQSNNIAKSISIFSEKAFRSVEEIVKFLQFHDITYQKISHMKDLLYDLDAKVSQVKNWEIIEGKDSIQHILELEHMCMDRAKQISQLRDTLTSAVTRILENLDIVRSNIHAVSDNVGEIISKKISQDQTLYSDMDHSLSSIKDAVAYLHENADHSQKLSKTIISFSETLREINAFLENIERIEDDIKLISFNALIKAAKRGKGGKPLGVIAESIGALLTDIHGETTDISRSLRSIISTIENLSARVTKDSESDTEVARKNKVLKAMVDDLYQMNQDLSSALSCIDSDSRTLSEAIEKTIRGISTHVNFSDICNRIIIELQNMGSHARVLITEKDTLETDMFLKRKPSREDALGTELGKSEEIQTDKSNGKKDEFEDNVEIF